MENRKLPFNLFLIGFMGCGKSSAADYLHRTFDMPVIEMDAQIEQEAGMPVSEIFRTKGEPAFRKMETGLLEQLKDVHNTVVSCGGGVPMREENVRLMRKSGKVVLLTAEPETILARVGGDHSRPLLEGRRTAEGIAALMEQRRDAYEAAADVRVATDGKDEAEICREILEKVTQDPGQP